MSEATINIHQRMNQVMGAVKGVAKKQRNKHHNYDFASHDDVTEAIREAFVRFGIVQQVSMLSFMRDTQRDIVSVQLHVSWVNMDDPKDRVDTQIWSESQAGGKGGPSPQQIGAAVSYGVKLLQLKNFALVGGDVEDTDQQAPGQVGPVAAPVIEEGSFEYYAIGFDRIQTMEQFDQLMAAIAANRHKFAGSPQLAQLGALSEKARQRLSGGAK